MRIEQHLDVGGSGSVVIVIVEFDPGGLDEETGRVVDALDRAVAEVRRRISPRDDGIEL